MLGAVGSFLGQCHCGPAIPVKSGQAGRLISAFSGCQALHLIHDENYGTFGEHAGTVVQPQHTDLHRVAKFGTDCLVDAFANLSS